MLDTMMERKLRARKTLPDFADILSVKCTSYKLDFVKISRCVCHRHRAGSNGETKERSGRPTTWGTSEKWIEFKSGLPIPSTVTPGIFTFPWNAFYPPVPDEPFGSLCRTLPEKFIKYPIWCNLVFENGEGDRRSKDLHSSSIAISCSFCTFIYFY